MSLKKFPDFDYEKELWQKGYKNIAGVDEVGRGSFAGPIVAAAVIWDKETALDQNPKIKDNIEQINDSKLLKPRQREKLAGFIKKYAKDWEVAEVPVAVINRLKMGKASQMVFRKAVGGLKFRPDFLLADAFFVRYLKGLRKAKQKPIIGGDRKSISIAAASILAKVYRDKLMQKLARRHPEYGWGRNKGYGTAEHQKAIREHGLTRLHRKDFVKGVISV